MVTVFSASVLVLSSPLPLQKKYTNTPRSNCRISSMTTNYNGVWHSGQCRKSPISCTPALCAHRKQIQYSSSSTGLPVTTLHFVKVDDHSIDSVPDSPTGRCFRKICNDKSSYCFRWASVNDFNDSSLMNAFEQSAYDLFASAASASAPGAEKSGC